jgi:beta-glucanase (GH16 family)
MELYGSRPDATTGTMHYKCTKSGNHCKTAPNVYNIKTDSAYGGNATYGTQMNDKATFDSYTGATSSFNTYGLKWDADRITFYVNGRRVRYIDNTGIYRIEQNGNATLENSISALGSPAIPFSTVFGYAHSIILNLAVGGDGPRYSTFGYTGYDTTSGYVDGNLVATLPGTMEVDYIRVYQLANAPTPPPSDTAPPIVTISSPTNGQTTSGTITVAATATDNSSVKKVVFAIEGNIIREDTNGSDGWNASWDTPTVSNGVHSLKATAYDVAGNTKEAVVSVVVQNTSVPTNNGTTPPSPKPTETTTPVVVRAPTGQQVVDIQSTGTTTQGALVTLEPATIVNADTVAQITKVEFYKNDELIQTANASPFALDTSVLGAGTYNITQRTYFKDGSTSQKSQLITIEAKKTSSTNNKGRSLRIALIVGIVAVALGTPAVYAARYVLRRRFEAGQAKVLHEIVSQEGQVIRPGQRKY